MSTRIALSTSCMREHIVAWIESQPGRNPIRQQKESVAIIHREGGVQEQIIRGFTMKQNEAIENALLQNGFKRETVSAFVRTMNYPYTDEQISRIDRELGFDIREMRLFLQTEAY